jgi:hypothetical protein
MGFVQSAAAGFFPLDDELALLPGQLTPRLQEGLVRLSTHIPSFAKAASEFAFWTQVTLHRTTACRITEAAGATAVALQTQAAEHILHSHPQPPPGPDRLVLSVDGAMVPLVHGQWAEVRTLAVGEPSGSVTREGQEQVQTTALSYFSRLSDSATFGELATLEIHRRGVESASEVGAVVDGAEWCQTFIDLHAPQAVRILDFAHAASYVDAIGQTQGTQGQLLSESIRTTLCHDLKHSGPTTVVERLRTTVAEAGAPAETLTQLAYLEKRLEQMDYPRFVAEQWPIGSGSGESANKLVVEERMKGAGMHWAVEHVNPLLALRNAICSDRWVEVWSEIEDEQRRAERTRRLQGQRQRRESPQREARKGSMAADGACLEHGRQGDSAPAPALASPERPVAESSRQAASHPWRKAWSIRRQREIASTA